MSIYNELNDPEKVFCYELLNESVHSYLPFRLAFSMMNKRSNERPTIDNVLFTLQNENFYQLPEVSTHQEIEQERSPNI